MADLKTYQTNASVPAFLDRVPDARQREDARKVAALMQRLTGAEPHMWGSSIVGFGTYTYQSDSGRSGDWPLVGFAPRAKELVLYIMSGFEGHSDLMRELGRYKTGKSCLYVRTLDDIKLPVLTRLIEASVAKVAQRYGSSAPAAKARPRAKAKPTAAARTPAKPKAPTKATPKAKAKAKAKSKAKSKATTKPESRATARSAVRSKAKPAAKPAARKHAPATRR